MVKIYETLFCIAYTWQTKIMKEKDIVFFATLITFSGTFVLYFIMILLFLIKSGILDKTTDSNNLIGYSYVTLILLINYLYFNKRYKDIVLEYDKNLPNIKKRLMFFWIILNLIPIIYIYYYILS